MSANEISEIYIPKPSRARAQRKLGLVLMTALCLFISFGATWGYGEVQYRTCLKKSDHAYASSPWQEHITWRTTKNVAASSCADSNVLPEQYLM
jgi:hypothetical protein